MAPLPGGDDIAGVLTVVRLAGDDPFTDGDLDPARQLAAGAVTAIELAQARLYEANLSLLEDRERIGRDMHDNVIGRLFGIGMNLQGGLNVVNDPTVTAARITAAVEDIDHAIKDIRDTIYGIRSRTDWGKGVRGAILAAVADQSGALGFEPSVNLDGPIDELADSVVEDLLAVVREALTNTAKYAGATTVTVAVSCDAESLSAQITDNGVGFTAPETGAALGGSGIPNMIVRADAHGGTATIGSQANRGTTITWTVPLKP